jgi:hypothetical protein
VIGAAHARDFVAAQQLLDELLALWGRFDESVSTVLYG